MDVELAQRQWDGYVAALRDAGWTAHEVPPAPDCPDSAFVEDTMVVYGDLAVISRPGAEERWTEIPGAADTVCELGYRMARIEAPGTLDGGDVLKYGGTVWVGQGRTHERRGHRAAGVPPRAARRAGRHRAADEGAAPQVGGHRATRRHGHRLQPVVDDPGVWGERFLPVPEEPGAHVVLLDDDVLLMSSAAPQSAKLFEERGYRVVTVDISEFEKLEGCVTCLSVRLRGMPGD